MGAWGTGLYSSDFAADMRPLIKTALSLPFDEDRIVAIIREREAQSADNRDDEDYANFWLALADQFAKRGVAHAETRGRAIAIIDEGRDLAMLERLGMTAPDLRKRAMTLAELRARLVAAPTISQPRKTLKAPLPYALETNTLYVCPTAGSAAINPYIGRKDFFGKRFVQDHWRLFLVVARNKSFGFLPWYQPLVAKRISEEKPGLAEARGDWWWELDSPKTCSERHAMIMEIKPLGVLAVDAEKLKARFPSRPRGVHFGWDGTSAAVNDITIGNCMAPSIYDWERWYVKRGELPKEGPTTVRSLGEVLRDEG